MAIPTQVDHRTIHPQDSPASRGSREHFGGHDPRPPAAAPPLPERPLSEDEIAMIALYADGLPIDAIARRLDLSDRTVRRRSRALCDRLGARATIQVVAWAARNRLI